jgi:hypothetical protein
MNAGTLSILLLAVFGFGLSGVVLWLRHEPRKRPEREDEPTS